MIKVLPDSVANQIAAGEVIQRPSSVVKELMENSVDAGSISINVIIKDAGKTSIQVVDNGCGMSDTDARLAFERHATSKISSVDDLMSLYTFGFRGEALPSIASISEIELKTRCPEDETGTQIVVNASTVKSQETISCQAGTSFTIKNLFFNVPARRKFLKSNNVEIKHIITEFQRVAICNPNIEFTLTTNETTIYNLPKGNIRQRIAGIFGKILTNNLIPVNVETSIVKIEGFVCKPEQTKKTSGDQFFFANGRFFKSAYFQKSVINAYDQLIVSGTFPAFFLFFTVKPENIDVNIHPTKVEVKFSEEQTIWQILNAAVRESLGKFSLAPKIDFDLQRDVEIPVITPTTPIRMPSIKIDETFNPFKNTSSFKHTQHNVNLDWEKLYEKDEDVFELDKEEKCLEQTEQRGLFVALHISTENFIQIKNKYIVTNSKSGLMIIDQKRAHRRILYEQFLNNMENLQEPVQQIIFPKTVELGAHDFLTISENIENLQKLGFDIRVFGKNTVVINGFPAGINEIDAEEFVHTVVDEINDETKLLENKGKERLAMILAKTAAISNKQLTMEEMTNIVGKLLVCKNPNICPEGNPTIITLSFSEIEKRFLK